MRWIGTMIMVGLLALWVWPVQAGWFSDERPPAGAKPLSEIIKMLEDQGLTGISDVEFDDGLWKIEVQQPDGRELDVGVNPMTGQIQSRR